MDSHTKRLCDAIDGYMEYANEKSYPVAAPETLNTLRNAVEGLKGEADPSAGGYLSPGQRELLTASEGVYEQVSLSEDAGKSPGEREVLANQADAS